MKFRTNELTNKQMIVSIQPLAPSFILLSRDSSQKRLVCSNLLSLYLDATLIRCLIVHSWTAISANQSPLRRGNIVRLRLSLPVNVVQPRKQENCVLSQLCPPKWYSIVRMIGNSEKGRIWPSLSHSLSHSFSLWKPPMWISGMKQCAAPLCHRNPSLSLSHQTKQPNPSQQQQSSKLQEEDGCWEGDRDRQAAGRAKLPISLPLHGALVRLATPLIWLSSQSSGCVHPMPTTN